MNTDSKILGIKISVIIPTYHRNDLLAKCLDCLAPGVQTLPAEAYEVIVTDDGSKTTAEQMIREQYPWAKWVSGSRRGPASNRNNGAKSAHGEWLAFTDDDCLPNPNWLEAYLSAATSEDRIYEGKTTCAAGIRSPLEIAPINHSGGLLWSCNIMVQRAVFEQVGGFDESFPDAAGEDIEFRERIKRLGYRYPFVESAIVDHPPRREPLGKKQGARLESQVHLWYKLGNHSYWRNQLLIHIKCRLRKVLDHPICLDSLLAVLSLIFELAYISRRIKNWEKKYGLMYGNSQKTLS